MGLTDNYCRESSFKSRCGRMNLLKSSTEGRPFDLD
jgi:hypothetical protein